jgi:hypothetical protein
VATASTLTWPPSGSPSTGRRSRAAQQFLDLRCSGWSWARVAQTLNELAVPTALAGRQWYPSTARNAALAYERDIAHDTAKSLGPHRGTREQLSHAMTLAKKVAFLRLVMLT